MIETFIAVDVETANDSRGSICQIGIAAYSGSNRHWIWSTLVNPEEAFDEGNVKIHGIDSFAVQAAPVFPAIFEKIIASLQSQFVVSHTRFDCDALHDAAAKYGLELPDIRWIDTCEVARFAWPALASHRLDALCRHLSVELNHHDAGSDAAACAEVLTHAVLETRMGIRQLGDRIGFVSPQHRRGSRQRRKYSARLSMAGAANAPLCGEVLVCTGDFSIGEGELVRLAASLGCDVEDRFSKKRTTMLIVGTRDAAQFNGKAKSNKLIAAEEAIASGKSIAILSEGEFLELASRCRAA